MQTDITFVHTADIHINTFTTLLEKHPVAIKVKHVVNSELLNNAMCDGITENLELEVSTLIKDLSVDSKLIVCTCSTLGGIAEATKLHNGQYAIRIDRAMADVAVQSAGKILVLAALESSLLPTQSLMNSSQQQKNTQNSIEYSVVENSWQHFKSGDKERYLQCIAKTIEEKQCDYDCIVLAQASMADATDYINEKRALILSSPSLGVAALLQKLVE